MSLKKTAHAFKSQSIAEALVEVGKREMAGGNNDYLPTGREVRVVKTPAEGIPASTLSSGEMELESAVCEIKHTGVGLATPITQGTNHYPSGNPAGAKVWNITDTAIEGGKFILAVRHGAAWVALADPSSSESTVRFRLKSGFHLDANDLLTADYTGKSSAQVVQTSAAAGSLITVYDPNRMFEHSVGSDEQGVSWGGSIGSATKYDYPIGSIYIVNECTQMINRYKCTVGAGELHGSDSADTHSLTIASAESVWPYVDADPSISAGTSVIAVNRKMLTANSGGVWIERRQKSSIEKTPINYTVPYADTSSTESEWVIVEVERPVARWIRVIYTSSSWAYNDEEFEGYAPSGWGSIDVDIPAGTELMGGVGTTSCLSNGTIGWAALDNTGSSAGTLKYVVIMTSAALAGVPREAALVGTDAPSCSAPPAENLVEVDGCSVKYKRLGKTYLFGDWDKTASGSCCNLDEYVDPIEVPFVNWIDQDVVETLAYDGTTGIQIDGTRKSIKVCSSTASSDTSATLPTVTTDVIEDITCSSNDLAKTYKNVTVVGTTNASAGPVGLGVAGCLDWESIYNTYIVTSNSYYVDYYDIRWPDGCDPCGGATGCCTVTYTDATTEDVTSTENWCTQKATDSNVTSTSWASGGACSSGSCEGGTISNFSIGGLGSGTCTADFTQTGTATISGGSATINGTYGGFDGSFPQSQAGTVTVTTDGTNWSWTGTISWEGSELSGSDTGTCTGAFSGSMPGTMASDDAGTCGITNAWINGIWSFDAT